jgi:hypothetical protein
MGYTGAQKDHIQPEHIRKNYLSLWDTLAHKKTTYNHNTTGRTTYHYGIHWRTKGPHTTTTHKEERPLTMGIRHLPFHGQIKKQGKNQRWTGSKPNTLPYYKIVALLGAGAILLYITMMFDLVLQFWFPFITTCLHARSRTEHLKLMHKTQDETPRCPAEPLLPVLPWVGLNLSQTAIWNTCSRGSRFVFRVLEEKFLLFVCLSNAEHAENSPKSCSHGGRFYECWGEQSAWLQLLHRAAVGI